MKKFALCVALAVMTTGAMAKEWKTVRIGVDAGYPPFESKAPSGEIVGFDADLTRALCAKMNVKCVWVEQDLDGIIPALKARKFDAIVSSLTITDQRREQIDYSDKLFDAPARMIAKAGSPLLPTVESLKGKRVGVEQGSAQADYAVANWQPAGVQIVSYQNQDQVYADLVTGRLDAAFQASIAASDGFLKKPQGKDFMFAGAPIDDVKYFGQGDGLGLRKQDTDLRDAFNRALAAILANGTYQRINRKYFDFDIYGAK